MKFVLIDNQTILAASSILQIELLNNYIYIDVKFKTTPLRFYFDTNEEAEDKFNAIYQILRDEV